MTSAFPIGVDKTVKEMAEKLNAPALQTENVSTANFTESPKYACFELVFGSDRDEEEASVCRKPQNMSTTTAKETCVRISPTLASLQQKQIRAQERRKVRLRVCNVVTSCVHKVPENCNNSAMNGRLIPRSAIHFVKFMQKNFALRCSSAEN